MIARNPDAASWKKATCSWPVPRSNTTTGTRVVGCAPPGAVTGCGSDRRCGVIGITSHLRVYEPLGAFPDRERTYWTEYVDSGTAPSRPVLMSLEHEAAVAAYLAVPPRVDLGAGDEHAYVRHLDGLTYLCPWRLQLRAWEAMDEFRTMLP